MACLASVACLPQTSGILGITDDTIHVGLSIDAHKNLQNILVATKPGNSVKSCITAPTNGAPSFEKCVDLRIIGEADGVQVSAIVDQVSLQAVVKAGALHRMLVVTSAGEKRFTVEVTGDSTKVRASAVSLPASLAPNTFQDAFTYQNKKDCEKAGHKWSEDAHFGSRGKIPDFCSDFTE